MGKKKKQKVNTYGFKALFGYYKKHLGLLIGYISIHVVKAVLNFFEAMFAANMIACIMDNFNYDKALYYAGMVLAICIVNAVLSFVNVYFYKNLENKTKIDIQQMVLKSSLDIQMKSYDKMGSGIIVTRLTADIDALSTEFQAITTRIVNLLKKATYVVYIFSLNVWLGLFLVGTIIVTILMSKLRIHYFQKMKPKVRSAAEVVNSKIIEVVRGVKDIKTLNCADSTLDMLKKDQVDYWKKDNTEWYVGVGLSQATYITRYICNFFFIVLCVYFLRLESITPLIFYTCYLYRGNIIDFATILEELKLNLGSAVVYANRIFMLTDKAVYEVDEFGDKDIENYSGKIKFKNVVFEYDEGIKVLNKATFEIQPKQTVAFVGESGSGKSSIINLISHLYYKSAGDIYFDDVKIEDLSRDFVKNNIAVVNQFPYIFNMSIRDNFKVIRPNITDEEIFDLCKLTNIYSVVKNLPDGLDSVIGENASKLSGGQKQKLCIARALARDVKILIFDEATSALDNANQREIMRVIEKLKSRVTVILIAHRLSTITYADNIYVLEGGKILSSGTHAELLDNCEYYKTLYNSSQSNV